MLYRIYRSARRLHRRWLPVLPYVRRGWFTMCWIPNTKGAYEEPVWGLVNPFIFNFPWRFFCLCPSYTC
jgi:hypothetical protein